MSKKTLGVIDYGSGNFTSVMNALNYLGLAPVPMASPADLDQATHIILPGVGAFGACMARLEERGFVRELKRQAHELKKPFLGICVGMQVLANIGTEHGEVPGLGFIDGRVERIPESIPGLRIPHIGWTEVTFERDCPLFHGMEQGSSFYFLHSYVMNAADSSVVRARCEYGSKLTACIGKDNVYGVQFHPEKSQNNGLRLLKNFVEQIEWSRQ